MYQYVVLPCPHSQQTVSTFIHQMIGQRLNAKLPELLPLCHLSVCVPHVATYDNNNKTSFLLSTFSASIAAQIRLRSLRCRYRTMSTPAAASGRIRKSPEEYSQHPNAVYSRDYLARETPEELARYYQQKNERRIVRKIQNRVKKTPGFGDLGEAQQQQLFAEAQAKDQHKR